MIGKQIAHYRIEAKLGEGGMGEVYRAHDTRLNRDVALKILPQVFAQDSERMARFEREAQVLASLNHTNIAQIYGLEEMASGFETRDSRRSKTKALVLEMVEGETLQEQIARGPIPVDEALKIALQICEGLEAAHEKGIIHRDLKPANIKITPEGQVKILDFGLAKALEGETPVSDLSHSPTLTHQSTQAGVILGTAAYMSPEQAAGRLVDKRTDIWAFGVILYELTTGRPLFTSGTTTELLADVLRGKIDWTALPDGIPNSIQQLLRRCLNREPRMRLQAIGDARIILIEAASGEEEGQQPALDEAIRVSERRRFKRVIIGMALLIAALTTALVLKLGFVPENSGGGGSETKLIQLTANAPELTLYSASISPDGRYLAYTDSTGLYLRLLETGETRAVSLDGEFRPRHVSWYPDSTRLLFVAADSTPEQTLVLWSVATLGGRPRPLVDSVCYASVSPDGTKIAFLRERVGSEIWLMSSEGENPRTIFAGDPGVAVWSLTWWRDSSSILYGWARPWDEPGKGFAAAPESLIGAVGLDGTVNPSLISDPRLFQNFVGTLPLAFSPDGRLIYGRRELPPNQQTSNLWSVEIDPQTLQFASDPRRLTRVTGFNVRDISCSTTGQPRVSFLLERNQADVFVGRLHQPGGGLEAVQRLTYDERWDWTPTWTRDSLQVIFSSLRGAQWDLYRQDIEELVSEPLSLTEGDKGAKAVSPDGKWVIYVNTSDDVLIREPVLGGPPQEVLKLEADKPKVRCFSGKKEGCVFGEQDSQADQYVFYALHPIEGKGEELARIDYPEHFIEWDISPGGDKVAIVNNLDRIKVIDFSTSEESLIVPEGWTRMEFVAWDPSGNGFYVNGSRVNDQITPGLPGLIHVNWQGQVTVLRRNPSQWIIDPTPSPDGRHLAFVAMNYQANAWMLEDY